MEWRKEFKAAVVLLELEPGALAASLKENYVISCAYWLLNITDSTCVIYNAQPPQTQTSPTQAAQQGVGFIGLAYLMGLVKEPTAVNAPACKKCWAAGLAGIQRENSLVDSFTDVVWKYVVDKKPSLYSHVEIRRELMTKYLSMGDSRENEPAIARAVLSQLDLVYKEAYLKTVNLMQLFTESGSRVLEIPSVLDEVMKLDSALTHVKAVEGENYSTCRLIDKNKYPTLNLANYPNLYAATLEWAKRNKKVPKNYLGNKALLDQAVNQDIVRRVLKMSSASLGSGSLTTEQREWPKNRKGYHVPATPLSDLLTGGTAKRAAATMDSETSESETDDEEERLLLEEGKAKSRRRRLN